MKSLMSNFSELALSRAEMKKVVGGCCIYYRDTKTGGYSGSSCGHSVGNSQYWYNNSSKTASGNHYVSGYCCASC
jgi:hypothetical protein